MGPRIDQAFAYLRGTELAAFEPGDYEIDGKDIYALALTYTTRLSEQRAWEAHRRYIDLQVMVEETERICDTPLGRLAPGAYDEAKDFWRLSGGGDAVKLPAGSFKLLWPTDGHRPCLAVPGTAGHTMDAPAPVRKLVVEIPVA